MIIKDTIKALLKSNFEGVQLSDARVEALAKRMEGKVTTEEEVLSKLESFNELKPLTEIASEDDRARTAQAELDKLKGRAVVKEKVEEEPAPTVDANKAILEAIKGLTDTVTALKGEKVITDRRSLITAKLATAGADYSAKVLRDFGRMSFATDEDFNTYLTDVETDFASHTQEAAESKLGKDAPFVGVGADGKVKEATQGEIDSLFGDIKL